jgi:glycosyltransferase involved in cell wall biosynthesis
VKIAIDARELQGKPTGVGRFLAEILAVWKTMPEAQAQEFVLLAPDGVAPGNGILWEQVVLPRLVREARADVLFSPAYSGPMFPPVPMVVAIHDVSFAAHPEWFSWREGARRRTTTQLAARAATRVVTISEFSKREVVAHLGIDSSKVVVAYPGVTTLDVGRTFKTRLADHEDKASHTGSPHTAQSQTILFVGSIFNRRHVPELIDGFARLARAHPDARLEIVGDNRTSPRVDLASAVRTAGLHDRIQLRSYVTDQELHALYAGACAFAFLSEYEGFGLTPLEAMSAGLPVLLLDTAVAREVCGAAAMYVTRPDPALIEDALTALLFDARERQRLREAADRVLATYSWTECARQVLRVLLASGRG